jgi:hypothetical protein
MLSTPAGKSGFFYENWEHGGDEWERVAVPATECLRVSGKFLEEERRQMGEIWFRQEYLCEFMEDDRSLISRDLVERAFEDFEPLGI